MHACVCVCIHLSAKQSGHISQPQLQLCLRLLILRTTAVALVTNSKVIYNSIHIES